MLCRIEHIGDARAAHVSIGGYTLTPGFTSPNIEVKDNSPEHMLIKDWVQEGLIKILDPSPTKKGRVPEYHEPGVRKSGNILTAKEVKLARRRKRDRNSALSKAAMRSTGKARAIGTPFGLQDSDKARILTAKQVREGVPKLKPKADLEEEVIVREQSRGTLNQEELAEATPFKDHVVNTADIEKKELAEPVEGKILTAEEVRGEEPIINEDSEEANTELVDFFVEALSEMKKGDIVEMAEADGIEVPAKMNKAPLIKLVAEAFVSKGYIELPGN